jgi:predicted GIY-YIG superfamily endonuclease
MLRDKLLARIADMGGARDDQLLASEVLGIRGASPELARKLVAQALVVEDRREAWRSAGDRICRGAPSVPGVYILRDADGVVLYVGKAINLQRRLRTHFAERRWRAIKPELSRVVEAEWIAVGSELEALLREAALIGELRPVVNVQTGPPDIDTRAISPALVKDVLVVVQSVEEDSAELVGARADGGWMIQRTRRNGSDLAVHARRVVRFFTSALRRGFDEAPLAPLVFSWLAGRGQSATRLDPHDSPNARALALRLGALLRDDRLFHERLEQC